jgi:hypothetical protein
VGGDDELALRSRERCGRLTFFLDRPGDRRDLGGRRPAAAADDPRAEGAGLSGELCEVLGRGVRIDHTAPGEAGQADVGEGSEWPSVAHRFERGESGMETGAVVGADRGQLVARQPLECGTRRDAAEGLRVLVEREHGDDGQPRDALHGLDRRRQLLQLEEGFDHEQIDTAPLE